MKSKSFTFTEINLILDQVEAQWLKGVMQNPSMHDESETDKNMRETLWDALDEEGVKSV